MKEYVVRSKLTGEKRELAPNQVLAGVFAGLPAIVTRYHYATPEYIKQDLWEIMVVNDVNRTSFKNAAQAFDS